MDRQRLIESLSGTAVLVFLAIGCFVVLAPFLTALMWAVVLCYASWPAYRWVESRTGHRRTLTALLMTGGVGVVLVLPFVIVGITLAENVTAWVQAVKAWIGSGPPPPPEWLAKVPLLGPELVERWTHFDLAALREAVPLLVNPLRDLTLAFGGVLGRGTVELGLSVFIAFFVFRRGDELAHALHLSLSRLVGERARHYLDVAGGTIQGVVYGILGTALAQGVLAGIGFWLVGVPGALFLGLLTFFFSLIPMGPPLVWGPVVLWLASGGHFAATAFMAVWGFFVISGIDNIIKPWLISRGAQMPFVLVFLGVIGGVLAFGFIGVFLGPVLLAVGYTVVLAWMRGKEEAAAEGASSGRDGPATG